MRNDKQKMQNLVATDKAFSNIKRDTAELMSEFASIQLPSRSKKGGYDMCKAVMEIKQEGFEEGREEGEENLLDLYAWLKQNNRIEEAEAIMIKENKDLRKKLQLEYKEKANN